MHCAALLLLLACAHSFRSLPLPRTGRALQPLSMAEYNFKDVKKAVDEKMKKSVASLQQQFSTLRAGGANPAVLDRVFVDYFGTPTPLNQVARVAAQGSQMLVVEPFDKSIVKDIEKAITMADLNLTPTNDGSGVIRIGIPPLTEDRRKALVKQSKGAVEESKVAVRNIRRDAVDGIKKAEKDAGLSKDNSKDYQDAVQKLTDDFIKQIDALAKTKEKDLLTM